MRKPLVILCLVVIGILVGYYIWSAHSKAPSETSEVLHVGPAHLYPDPNFTPGDVISGVTEKVVCTPEYAESIRHVTHATKIKVFRRQGLRPENVGDHELDHFISLELGGSNDLKNLWVELGAPRPGYHEKDRVENYLHREVCAGRMPLREAQEKIRKDWYLVYLNMPK